MLKLWKKKQPELPSGAICRNCGTQTVGRYCHACGQDIVAGQGRPIFQFIAHLLDNAFALDGKILLTLRYLLIKPGFLSSEYRLGKIIRYVQPVKLFWMSTLIFFALLIATMNTNVDKNRLPTTQEETAQLTVQRDTTDTNPTAVIKVRGISGGETEAKVSYKQFKDYFATYAPYVAFLFIPIFALLLKLFFRRKKYFYLYHLTFAVHFHSFLWILWSFLLVLDLLFPDWHYPNLLNLFITLLPGAYFMIALYRFYQPKRKWSAIWKALVITLLYVLLILLFLIGIIILLIEVWNLFNL
jgi:hypothetical protein